MIPPRQVARALDDEHRANLALLGRLEHAFVRAHDGALPALLGTLAAQLQHELPHHFAFEEQQLFPRMARDGAGDLATLLGEEHAAIRAVVGELLPLARAGAGGTLASSDAPALRRLALELVERLRAHIDKETAGLLPLLDDLLDDELDRELAFGYLAAA